MESNSFIYCFHKIRNFVVQEEKPSKITEYYDRETPFEYTLRRVRRKNTLKLIKDANIVIEKLGLKNSQIDINKDNFEEKEFLNFILNKRISEKLEKIKLIDLGEKYKFLFLPELFEKDLIYDRGILFKVNVNHLENDFIQYIEFLDKKELYRYFDLAPALDVFFKTSKINDFLIPLKDKFEINSAKINRIRIVLSLNEIYGQINLLEGFNEYYINITGSYTNLGFLMFLRKLFDQLQ